MTIWGRFRFGFFMIFTLNLTGQNKIQLVKTNYFKKMIDIYFTM